MQQMPMRKPLNGTALVCRTQHNRRHLVGLSIERHLASSRQEFLHASAMSVRLKYIKRCSQGTCSVKLNLLCIQFHAASFGFTETKRDEGSHCRKQRRTRVCVDVPASAGGQQLDKGATPLCSRLHRLGFTHYIFKVECGKVAGLHSLPVVSTH